MSQVVETRERPPSVKTCAETRFAAPKSFREINKDTGRDDYRRRKGDQSFVALYCQI
ncbi:hypothetical protein N9L76_02640 [bacterium]|nr:hypothetical protein [bacterium]